ncbi:MAG: ATP synthase F1 subunit gamma [candidate division WOR-3 bacterium]
MVPLRSIRGRIRSVERIRHITGAMKTVSAIRLMKVQNQVLRFRPYAAKLHEVVDDLVARTTGLQHPLLGAPDPRGQTLRPDVGVCLVLGSDRGLCGSYNNNLLAEAIQFLQEHCRTRVQLEVLGKKLSDLMAARGCAIGRTFHGVLHDLSYAQAAELAENYLARYQDGEISSLWAIYTQFRTTARQKVTRVQLLPIAAWGTRAGDDAGRAPRSTSGEMTGDPARPQFSTPLFPEYQYEPDPAAVLGQLLPLYFKRELWRILTEARASEHLARMTAMDMATINANEMIQRLTLTYNKARQEAITRELSEIATASEAFRE